MTLVSVTIINEGVLVIFYRKKSLTALHYR